MATVELDAPVSAWPFVYDVVQVAECFVDAGYQRPRTSLAKEIGRDFRPYLVGTLIVSQRNRNRPSLALIDGQNRWAGAVIAGQEHLPAVIYSGLSRAQEALIFSDLQTKRRNLASYDKYRAALVGKDPTALAIAAIVTEAGYELGTDKKPDTVKAVGALEWAYRGGRTRSQVPLEAGPEYLRRVMQALRAGWPDISQPSGDIIKGATLVYVNANGKIDDARMIRSIKGTSPREILSRAADLQRGRATGGSGAFYAGEVMTGNYSKTSKSRK